MSARTLAQLQQRFQDYVARGTATVEDFVVADARADAVQRMDVYYHAYRLRLLEVLGEDYPALAAVAGKAAFDAIGRAYIDAHPSTDRSVRWFGRGLAAFLRTTRPAEPLLAELADFEWAQGEVFDARDAPTLALDEVARIPGTAWPDMRLTVQPALRRLDLEWNVPQIVQAVDAGTPRPQPQRAQRTGWVLWRHELTVRWRSLSVDEAVALDAVGAGATFAEVCDLVCEHVDPDAAGMHVASLLKRWLTDGLISTVHAG